MAVWETDNELSDAAAASLPTPTDTPYRTPSRSSRRSRRSTTPPGIASSPPPPLPMDKIEKNSKRSSKDVAMDENISILDPRRFTPTLHANLVSEILALRRDQEEKLKIIESLECSLHTTREEQESLQTNLSNTAKETRSLKRQLALLEGGTSSALGELAKERDDAVEAITETRRRLEVAQKKVRTHEEDSQRVHDLWAKEKDDWDEERRKYERKLHVAESRLRVVLEEVANLQASQANGINHGSESDSEGPGKENDGASVRTMSMTNSIRFSVMSGPGFAKPNGHSLADELNFDDDDDYQTDPDGRQSVLSNPRHHRNQSRDSIMSKSHRRNQSSDGQIRPGSVARSRIFMNQTVLDRLEGGIREDDEDIVTPPKVEYTDTGVQFSPPPSPKMAPAKPSTPEPTLKNEKLMGLESPPRTEGEIEANQSRKRVYITKPTPIESPKPAKSMVSASSQTSEKPAQPLATSNPLVVETKPAVASVSKSISTQTDPIPTERESLPPPPLSIPSISIIPPTSRPSTPREHRLPQYVKDFGCQVSLIQSKPTKSMAVQTDEIRIDRRLDKLPPHLHPSAISSRPTSPTGISVLESKDFTPVPGHVPPRNPRRLEGSRQSFSTELPSSPPISPIGEDLETRDAYPGNNDDGPLSNSKAPVRRPHRISSLFAGFDAQSSDEADEFDGDQSDSEYRTALAPRPKTGPTKPGKRSSLASSSLASTASPEQVKPIARQAASVMSKVGGPEVYSSFRLADAPEGLTRKPSLKVATRAADRAIGYSTGSRASVMRKSAMIQSGIASHQGRSRSPSLPESRDPPFPIPTRASSRKPPFSISAPSDGQRSPTHRGAKGAPYRNNSVRKVRSAAALPGNRKHRRHGSRSPPPMSPSEEAPESPGLPPLPTNDVTTPRRDRNRSQMRSHRSQPSTNTANTENTNMGSTGSNQQSSSVVDAIAQTMVGEWMFKYVRRRKSFGVADGNNRGEENSNDRHKRWVWLAPYERAILWSSKQPASGNALMGKPGRKLTIQSVLDVKDDNPPPKGITNIFNRSILILTPQRALKFTATSAERHYLWLTSLSFLAHSQQDVPEIIPTANSPNIGPAPEFEPPQSKVKKPGIRDSIRLTKGKNPALMTRHDPPPSTNQLEEALSFKQEAFPPIPVHQRELSREAAEPPFIPRFHERSHDRVHERANQVVLHGRKRSNTGGHVPPPLSFRGFSGPASHSSSYHASTNSTAGNSVGTAGSSDIYQSQASSNITWGLSTAGSQRTSEASSRPPGNFFEAIGTVRMEAFISPLTFPRFEEHPDEEEEWRYRARRRSKEMRRRRSRSRHRDSYASRGTRGTDSYYAGSRQGEEDFFRDDPFKGF
ncbi:uncharacterized protein F4822DRAFT_437012 [Hypoxylon trugodes]|uniref:uncharacterized protein n=1 Tax=Hypoxylon trugodes TaxID=326681 RepID=UPI00218CB229|nr:uncharacterized protein F4822DRAFT_437012 [Hypoxylon trugodes]KAI1389692.1 hypothetical protein F4822DRAFT_437012 [Hypoxylon trugodes]